MTREFALKMANRKLEGMVPEHMKSVFEAVADMLQEAYLKGWTEAMVKAHWASWDIS